MKLSEWHALTDRERDALVAEKVMGLRIREYRGVYAMGEYDFTEEITDGWSIGGSYTASIEDAWEVVEKLRPEWPGFSCCYDQDDEEWEGEFQRVLGCDPSHMGYAATAPLAICTAAMLAVGALEEDV